MKKPKMIMFDYGHTLIYEREFDGIRGTKEVLKYATHNEKKLSAEDVSKISDNLFDDVIRKARDNGIEVHNHMFQQMLYEYLQIEIPLKQIEIEQLFWNNASPGETMPNVEELLCYMGKNDIRSGVISNISFSGEAMKNRLNRLIPNNNFEFIITSSEYMFCKPNAMLFELALKKSKLNARDVWYCGDNIKCDIFGASSVGMYPVWYHSEKDCFYRDNKKDEKPECEHLYIRDWKELINILQNME